MTGIRLSVTDSIATTVDEVDVTTVVPPPGEQVSAGTSAVSFFNPARMPAPDGTDVAGASLSYYNPAQIPSPDGVLVAGRASVSYYNPATIPSPDNSVATNVASVSYFNPAQTPSPSGVLATEPGEASVITTPRRFRRHPARAWPLSRLSATTIPQWRRPLKGRSSSLRW